MKNKFIVPKSGRYEIKTKNWNKKTGNRATHTEIKLLTDEQFKKFKERKMNYTKKRKLRYWLRNEFIKYITVAIGFIGFIILISYYD